jgi:murein DD-endopeptidase MepM/ murein hydrolase activator NlpD
LPLAAIACGRDDDPAAEADPTSGVPNMSMDAMGTMTAPASAATPNPTPALDVEDLHGFAFPIADACMPTSDNLLPNAPRRYRQGVHEGLDFYPGLACAPIAEGTAVLAMHDGTVIRADTDYVELTRERLAELRQLTAEAGTTPPDVLDEYRGRQVWVDHGHGIVTRYCHLSFIVPGLAEGAYVRQGQPIAGVGESGTPESLESPGTEMHLHAEVRVGDTFLGQGLPADIVRALYARLFEPA